MKEKKIKLIDNSVYSIMLEDQDLLNHFENPNNYTEVILDQFNSVNYYQDFISESDKVILDLGANVGLFALYVSPIADKIICVEPTPSHFDILTKLTKNISKIEKINGALSNISGEVNFYTSTSNTTTNSLISRDVDQILTVKSYNLRDLIEITKLDKVDFVKMDIEGGEYIVLDEETIQYIDKNIPKILIEFHDCQHTNHALKYIEIFKNLGFEINHFHWDSVFFYKK